MPYGGRGRVQRHHVDSDRLNNSAENIRFLCAQHHRNAHRDGDGVVGGGPRPRVAAMLRDRAIAASTVARTMALGGMTTEQIAQKLEVNPWTVRRWFRKYPE